jgi:N6-L-threonylcarbamoyladenine synthase
LDDAAGEAFDKVGKFLGLAYPGGKLMDALARAGTAQPKLFPRPYLDNDNLDFSFSGLKTAVLRLVKSFDGQELPVNDICASFQECVSKTLVKKLRKAVLERGYNQVVIAGGVAANSEIRKKVFDLEKEGFRVCAPPMKYCTDNASMVASCAYFNTNTFDDVDVEVFSRVK